MFRIGPMKAIFKSKQLLVILLVLIGSNKKTYAQWANVGPGGEALSSVSFRTATDGWICGANGALFRTSDGGTTWQSVAAFQTTGARNRLLSVSTQLQFNVTVLAQQPSLLQPTQVYYSQYNGRSFVPSFPSTVASDDFAFMSSHATGLNILVGAGGSLRLSLTQGASWAQLPSGTQRDLWGADSPDGVTYYLVGSNGTLRRGTFPGTTSQALNSGTFVRLTGVWFINAQQGYIIGDGGTALRTANGGVNWTPMAVNTMANLRAVRFLNATTGFIAGDLGTLLSTTDGGATWQPEASNTFETLNDIYATPDGLNIWVVGGSGTVLKRGAVVPLASQGSAVAKRWQAYPNPFTTALSLVDVATTTAAREVSLVDQLGRTVFQHTIAPNGVSSPDYPLALPVTLAPGIYSLRLVTPGQAMETRQVVRLP